MSSPLLPLEKSVRRARRRLFGQALMSRLPVACAIALGLGAVWVAAGPYLTDVVPLSARWPGVGVLAALGGVAGVVWARRATPDPRSAALEVDTRFGLQERITTALGLSESERATPAGQAVLADAVEKIGPVAVRERFPVRPRWHALLVPVTAASVVLLAFYPAADVAKLIAGEPTSATTVDMIDKKPVIKPEEKPPTVKKPEGLKPRAEKSKALQELEDQKEKLDQKYDTDPAHETQDNLKAKTAELTALEEKVKKLAEQKAEKLQQLDQQLEQLQRLNEDKEFQDGPAKKLAEKLEKGDLQGAMDEIATLKKKTKDGTLTKDDTEKLARQLDQMKSELEKSRKVREQEQKLEKALEKAKAEGREKDAESLTRELQQAQEANQEASEAAKDLKEAFQKAKDALEKGDLEEAAKELGEAAKSLEATEGELEDLEDAEQFLQRLKGEKKEACKKCNGEGDGDGEVKPNDDYDGDNNARGAGRRKENKDAASSKGNDERIRGIFDPKGRKTYGGSTQGKGFKSASVGELGEAIQAAAQEAPTVADSQRLPRDAKDAVKEYFEALGGHK